MKTYISLITLICCFTVLMLYRCKISTYYKAVGSTQDVQERIANNLRRHIKHLAEEIGRSDHKSFWLQGHPTFMITDTANFRNRRYHTKDDRADSINYSCLAKVTKSLSLTLEHIAMQDGLYP